MTWVRIDEGFPEHPKVLCAGGDAGWLHVCALSYCNRQLTDGFIPRAVLSRLSDRKRPQSLASRLVEVGLWELVEGGWMIHDYLLYQPTRAKTEETRERTHSVKAEAGRLGGIASGVARRKHTGKQVGSKNEAEGKPNTNESEARSGPVRPVLVSQSSTDLGNAMNGHDDDQFMHAIEIIVEHKFRHHPPNGPRRAWELTVVPNTITEDGTQIRELLSAGKSPLDAASTVIGSARSAEIAESKLA